MRERRGGADVVQNEAMQQEINKLILYSEKLAQWDKRISEIVGIGNLAKGVLAPQDTAQLVCTFDPEPQSEGQGFFSIANLLVRDEFERFSEKLNINHSVDVGFRLGPKAMLPNGKIIDMPEEQIKLWPRDDERQHTK